MGKSEVLYFHTFGQAQSYYLRGKEMGRTVSTPFQHLRGWAVVVIG